MIRARTFTLISMLSTFAALACSEGLPPEKDNKEGGAGETSGDGAVAGHAGAGGHSSDGGGANGGGGGNGRTSDGGSPNGAGPDGSGIDGGDQTHDASAGGQRANSAGGRSGSGGNQSSSGGTEAEPDGGTSTGGSGAATYPDDPKVHTPASTGHACDSNWETNDAPETACKVVVGQTVDMTSLKPPDDANDYFVMHVEAGVAYTIAVDAHNCQPDNFSNTDYLNVALQNLGSGHSVQDQSATTDFGAYSYREFFPKNSGDELIQFTSGGESCAYSFQIVQGTKWGLSHKDYEPNETASTFAPLPAYPTVDTTLAPGKDANDYFEFPAKADGTTYVLTVDARHCPQDNFSNTDELYLTARDLGAGNAVQNFPLTVDFGSITWKDFTVQTDGMEEFQFDSPQSCSYHFDVLPGTAWGLKHDATTYEPNNTAASAAPIDVGQKISSVNLTPPADPADYYSFQVKSGTTYTLTVSTENCSPYNSSGPQFNWSLMSLGDAGAVSTPVKSNGNVVSGIYFGSKGTFTFTPAADQAQLEFTAFSPCAYDFTIAPQ